MKQQELFPNDINIPDKSKFILCTGMYLKIEGGYSPIASLYIAGVFVRRVKLKDKIEKKLFILDVIELGAQKTKLAIALGVSRQSIDNYLNIRKYFGLEGIIRGYSLKDTKNIRNKRKKYMEDNNIEPCGIVEQIAEIKRKEKAEKEALLLDLPFTFGSNEDAEPVEAKDQPFADEHDWTVSRYAGTFVYIIALISQWKWLKLIMGYFGNNYRIFMVFLLMVARNTRSIEQIKNIRSKEAGIVIGIKQIINRHKVWEWFYSAADMRTTSHIISDYFRFQLYAGIVGTWMWFIDGHLLPYTGKSKVHYSYNTQRRMPVPGQTNMVTCDKNGCIVDFDIQEGKGDLRQHVSDLAKKWKSDVPAGVIMVFDREGSGIEFFSKLVQENISFITWEKNINTQELAKLDNESFSHCFTFNDKQYCYFEGEKLFTYTPPKDSVDESHTFTLRRFYIWNKSSNRRTCGLAWTANTEVSAEDCIKGILNRWGASENTFKHIKDRHPLHYHPGFKMVESEKQDIANPKIKEKKTLIARAKKKLAGFFKQLVKAKDTQNKDGTIRKNSKKEQLVLKVKKQEEEINILEQEKKEMPDRIDVSTLENYKSFQRIDNEGKEIFDFVTSSVWNARKLLVNWLRPLYNCENELVDLFYTISYCHGWIKNTKHEVIVRLEPLEQPKRRQAQEQFCRKLSEIRASLPTGKILRMEVGDSPCSKK